MSGEQNSRILGDTFTADNGRVFHRLRGTWLYPWGPTGEVVWDSESREWVETDAAFSTRIKDLLRESSEWGKK
jgi:hypothetical protein